VQASPEFRGRTTLLVTTDHGRGAGHDWTDHGREVPAAERIWVAMLGPKPVSAGQRSPVTSDRLTQSQFAATIAAALGLEAAFRRAKPNAAPAIPWE